MKFLASLLFCFVFLCSTTTFSYTAERVFDELNRGEYHKVKGNQIDASRYFYEGIKSIELNPARYLTQNRDIFYFLILEIKGTAWILVEDRKSLTLVVDGHEYSINVYQRPKREQYPRFFLETVWYQLPDKMPQILAKAKEIKIKIKGKYGRIDETLKKENHEVFDYFYKTFILTPLERKDLEQKQKYNVSE